MNLLIQSGTNYSKEKLIEPLTELILAGFEAKFTHHFFTQEEARNIATALSTFLSSEKSENLIIAEKIKKFVAFCILLLNMKAQNY